MKILLIMIPRSGSVSLLKGLSNSMKLDMIGEPFNSHLWKEQPKLNKKNIIVKTFIHQTLNNITPLEFYLDLSKDFDKVIIISRKKIKKAVESYVYNLKSDNIQSWVSPYYIDDTLDIENHYKWFLKMNYDLKLLSKILNVKMDWYEDIFSGDENKIDLFINKHQLKLDKKNFIKYLNPKNKYRKTKPIII